jgi:hypothetical protein
MNAYKLTDEVEKKHKSKIMEYISNLEKNSSGEELELTQTELNPYTLGTLLENLGYKKMDIDTNGWEMDFWITYSKEGFHDLVIAGTGINFELKLYGRELQ